MITGLCFLWFISFILSFVVMITKYDKVTSYHILVSFIPVLNTLYVSLFAIHWIRSGGLYRCAREVRNILTFKD